MPRIILRRRLQVRQHVDAPPFGIKLAGPRKLHDLPDNQLGDGVFAPAVELQHVANPMEGCAHRFETFGVFLQF
jgi:hypothetical protein